MSQINNNKHGNIQNKNLGWKDRWENANQNKNPLHLPAKDSNRRGQTHLPGLSAPEFWCHDQEDPFLGSHQLEKVGHPKQGF